MAKKCFLLIISLITLGSGVFSSESYALNDDPALKLYFTFDEGQGDTVKDHSQSKLKGKLTGNAKFIKDGKFGGALSLEDKDCLVQVPASDELDITKAITMAAWTTYGSQQGWILSAVEWFWCRGQNRNLDCLTRLEGNPKIAENRA